MSDETMGLISCKLHKTTTKDEFIEIANGYFIDRHSNKEIPNPYTFASEYGVSLDGLRQWIYEPSTSGGLVEWRERKYRQYMDKIKGIMLQKATSLGSMGTSIMKAYQIAFQEDIENIKEGVKAKYNKTPSGLSLEKLAEKKGLKTGT